MVVDGATARWHAVTTRARKARGGPRTARICWHCIERRGSELKTPSRASYERMEKQKPTRKKNAHEGGLEMYSRSSYKRIGIRNNTIGDTSLLWLALSRSLYFFHPSVSGIRSNSYFLHFRRKHRRAPIQTEIVGKKRWGALSGKFHKNNCPF